MALSIAADIRSMFGNARDQGQRETCLSFAVSDTHAALRTSWVPLSCEFLHYHAQRIGGRRHDEGAVIDDMLTALKSDGQPEETGWPYITGAIHTKSWKPPSTVGAVYKRDGDRSSPNAVDTIVKSINDGVPIVVHMYLSDAFYSPKNAIVVALAGEKPDFDRRHAVIAVAHGDLDGNRVVLVRNSWGADWGDKGHAWLPEEYLSPRIRRLTTLTGEL